MFLAMLAENNLRKNLIPEGLARYTFSPIVHIKSHFFSPFKKLN